MNLEQLLTDLSYGEVSNLYLSLDGTGGIIEQKRPQVILFINDGLTRLHTKFNLKTGNVLIELVEGITNYILSSKYAESSYDPNEVKYPYIKDMNGEPFKDDAIRITDVFTSLGQLLPLNDREKRNSVFTPSSLVLQVPTPVEGMALSVVYRANHERLSVDDLNQEINIPDFMFEALRAYVAYKAFSSISTQESVAKSQECLMMYETLCSEYEINGLLNSLSSESESFFEMRGWV